MQLRLSYQITKGEFWSRILDQEMIPLIFQLLRILVGDAIFLLIIKLHQLILLLIIAIKD